MKTIWKFDVHPTLTNSGRFELEMPKDAEFLHIEKQNQNGKAAAWFLVDTENEKELRNFQIIGTGEDIPKNISYLGTFLSDFFVWHLFEVGK